jgi:hypothetical protein
LRCHQIAPERQQLARRAPGAVLLILRYTERIAGIFDRDTFVTQYKDPPDVCELQAGPPRGGPALADSVAILVASCDRYRDLWAPFFSLFRRYWPDCPFRVYLLSNTVPSSYPRVTSILVGKDESWSDSLSRALQRLEQEYVLLFIDDLLLIEKVDTSAVMEVLRDFVARDGNYLRMNPIPKPDHILNCLLGSVSKKTIYRTATVSSVWKRRTLLALLVRGESAWDFETRGTIRSDAYDGFYSTHTSLLHVVNSVVKGRWERGALTILQRIGVKLDIGDRPVMTWVQSILFRCRVIRIRLLYLLPAQMRRPAKQLFTRGLRSSA